MSDHCWRDGSLRVMPEILVPLMTSSILVSWSTHPMGLSTEGPEAEKEVWRDALRAMPDIRHDIQEVISDGSRHERL